MDKDFVIENGTLLRYQGKHKEIVIPEEVITINSNAIRNIDKVILNSNCKKICKSGIDANELIIPIDSKLSIVEECAISQTRTPIALPDGIKVMNGFLPSISRIPRNVQTIKKTAMFNNQINPRTDQIFYLPDSLRKIEERALNHCGTYYTKQRKPLDGWKIDNIIEDKIAFNIIDETIYDEDDFKYVLCEDEYGKYAAIVSIPFKPLVIIPESIKGYVVRVVIFNSVKYENSTIIPALYVSKHVSQISNLWQGVTLIGNNFNIKLQENQDFLKLKEKGLVHENIDIKDLRHEFGYYFATSSSGAILLRYDGDERKSIVIPESINGTKVIDVSKEAFEFLQGEVEFIKYPLSCKIPERSKVSKNNMSPILVNEEKVQGDYIFNYFNKSLKILGYYNYKGFKMIHIKDVDEEGYVIYKLEHCIIHEGVIEPPTKVNGFKVLGVNCRLLSDSGMDFEMAKNYFRILKKLY